MLSVNQNTPRQLIKMKVGTGGIKKGQLAKLSSDTAIVGTEGISTAIVVGIAFADYDENDIGLFWDVRGQEIQADIYQGGATDAFTDADIGKAFDLYTAGTTNEFFVDPNDTTGSMVILQSYNSANATCTVRMIAALCYV